MKTIGASDVAKRRRSALVQYLLNKSSLVRVNGLYRPLAPGEDQPTRLLLDSTVKSFKRMTSACSAPTHAKEPVAWITERVITLLFNGDNLKFFPELAVPYK